MHHKTRVSGMGSGKEKLGCMLSTLSPDELRGEEMHQENQTVSPLLQLPCFCYKKSGIFRNCERV